MPKKQNANQFSVFGTRSEKAVCLPNIAYSVRLNCKDGGLFVGGNEAQHRKTNPDQKVEISIIKVSKYFGTLGKTENALWIQLFFIGSPNVPSEVLPKNVVCVSYLKKQSIAQLYNTVQQALDFGDPGMGIFSLGFNKEAGEKGPYYTVTFDWRERQSEEEKQQLENIAAFMGEFGDQLLDLEATREMVCVDGWTAQQLKALVAQRQGQGQGLVEVPAQPSLPSLPAAS
jgi:hypothetical protein